MIGRKGARRINKISGRQLLTQAQQLLRLRDKWTDDDEIRLQSLKSKKLTLKDTVLGRLREHNERELKASFQAKSPEEQAAMIEELKRMHEGGGIVDQAAV